MCHKIADSHSFSAFIAAWATTAVHEAHSPWLSLPNIDATSIYPQILSSQEILQISQKWDSFLKRPTMNLVAERFTFDKPSITGLRKSSFIADLTHVQAVIALVWQCYMRARGIDRRSKTSTATISVNMQGKATLPLPNNLFGDLVTQVVTMMKEAVAESKSRFEEKVSSAIKID